MQQREQRWQHRTWFRRADGGVLVRNTATMLHLDWANQYGSITL